MFPQDNSQGVDINKFSILIQIYKNALKVVPDVPVYSYDGHFPSGLIKKQAYPDLFYLTDIYSHKVLIEKCFLMHVYDSISMNMTIKQFLHAHNFINIIHSP